MFDSMTIEQLNTDHSDPGPVDRSWADSREVAVDPSASALLDDNTGQPDMAEQSAKPEQRDEIVTQPRIRPPDLGERMWDASELLAPDDRVAGLAGSRNLADSALIDMIADVIFSGQWRISGINSEHHWVAYKLGMSRRQAARLIVVAERRDELPYAFAEFTEGRLSLDQMLLIARFCPTGYDETLAEMAVNATIPQLRRIMRDYEFPDPNPEPDPKATDEPADDSADDLSGDPNAVSSESGQNGCDPDVGAGEDPSGGLRLPDSLPDGFSPADVPEGFSPDELDKPYRGMGYEFDDDGNFRMWLRCGADDGAEISAAMDQARAWLKTDTGETDVSGFEAFLNMIRAGIDADPSGARGANNRVVVHLDGRDLDAWANGLRPSLHLGPMLRSEAAELLTCDGSVQVVNYLFGRPVSLGLSQRLVPATLRRIILYRDNGCRFPGCSAQRWLDVHHMKHWVKGGRTDSNNLVTFCRRHHREHHRGLFDISGDPEILLGETGLRFVDSCGREISRPVPVGVPPPVGDYVHGTGESFDMSLVHLPPNGPYEVPPPSSATMVGSKGPQPDEAVTAEVPPEEDEVGEQASASEYGVRQQVPTTDSSIRNSPSHPGAP